MTVDVFVFNISLSDRRFRMKSIEYSSEPDAKYHENSAEYCKGNNLTLKLMFYAFEDSHLVLCIHKGVKNCALCCACGDTCKSDDILSWNESECEGYIEKYYDMPFKAWLHTPEAAAAMIPALSRATLIRQCL